jgi:hypothetical protein
MLSTLYSPLNLPIVVPTTLRGEKGRIIQEVEIVDRDDGLTVAKAWGYEIGAVQEINSPSGYLNSQ